MTIAKAWAELAKKENAAYRKKWGTGLQQQKREDPKPKRKGSRPLGTYNPERKALIKELIEEGFRTVDIANELGISESSVRYWKAKYFMK